MKKRIAIWAGVGFAVSSCFVLFSFLMPPDRFFLSLRNPAVQAFELVSFLPGFALRNFHIYFWWVPLINAATYAVIGLIVEMLRRNVNFRSAFAS